MFGLSVDMQTINGQRCGAVASVFLEKKKSAPVVCVGKAEHEATKFEASISGIAQLFQRHDRGNSGQAAGGDGTSGERVRLRPKSQEVGAGRWDDGWPSERDGRGLDGILEGCSLSIKGRRQSETVSLSGPTLAGDSGEEDDGHGSTKGLSG
ncbi:hypothetical protein BC567DRAFT_218106 [Phyllosticta citribraziliensis]